MKTERKLAAALLAIVMLVVGLPSSALAAPAMWAEPVAGKSVVYRAYMDYENGAKVVQATDAFEKGVMHTYYVDRRKKVIEGVGELDYLFADLTAAGANTKTRFVPEYAAMNLRFRINKIPSQTSIHLFAQICDKNGKATAACSGEIRSWNSNASSIVVNCNGELSTTEEWLTFENAQVGEKILFRRWPKAGETLEIYIGRQGGKSKLCYKLGRVLNFAKSEKDVVMRPTKKVALNKTSVTLAKGKQTELKATLTPSLSYGKVKWTSSNKKVVKIVKTNDRWCRIKAIGKGTATITAKAADGSGKRVTCKVTVK